MELSTIQMNLENKLLKLFIGKDSITESDIQGIIQSFVLTECTQRQSKIDDLKSKLTKQQQENLVLENKIFNLEKENNELKGVKNEDKERAELKNEYVKIRIEHESIFVQDMTDPWNEPCMHNIGKRGVRQAIGAIIKNFNQEFKFNTAQDILIKNNVRYRSYCAVD